MKLLKGNKLKFWMIGLAAFCAVASATGVFIWQMNEMIRINTMNTIQELASHDAVSIENFLDNSWETLDGITERMHSYQCTSIQQCQERLNLERASTEFYSVYLVGSDGMVYSDRYVTYTPDQLNLFSFLENSTQPDATRFDFATTSEAQKEMLVFSVPLEGFSVDGIEMGWICGLRNIRDIQVKMNINSFVQNGKSRGYASIFDKEGDFIVNINKTYSLNQSMNMFEKLKNGQMEAGWDMERVQNSLDSFETFHFNFVDQDGKYKLLYFAPINSTSWYFVSNVEQGVFSDLTRAFVFSGFMMALTLVLVCGAVLYVFYRHRRKAAMENARNDARTEFITQISHEIRSPLGGITGLLYLIDTHMADNNPGQIHEWISKAMNTSRYLQSLVSNVLDMSMQPIKKIKLAANPYSLSAVVDGVCDMELMQQNQSVNLQIDKDIVCDKIYGDPVRLTQVLDNLLSNAVKYSSPSSPITLTVTQHLLEPNRVQTIISVKDEGRGISEEKLASIWKPADKNSVPTPHLGLGICREIMLAMNGDLQAESIPGKGSVFTLKFISTRVSPDNQKRFFPSEESSLVLDEEENMNPKILLTEGTLLNRQIMTRILEDKGFQVSSACSGQETLEILDSSKVWEYDMLLISINLPDHDGFEITSLIRQANRSDLRALPIFAISSSSLESDRIQAEEAGMDGILELPLDIEEMMKIINEKGLFRYRVIRRKKGFAPQDSDSPDSTDDSNNKDHTDQNQSSNPSTSNGKEGSR